VINSAFLACMENILRLYRLEYDEQYPVICFDERSCFLIGDKVVGFELKAGQTRKQHYEYEKNGAYCLLMAIEPLTGKRLAIVYDRRRKIEYADFMKKVAEHWSQAKQIRLIQDNLNTHTKVAFYENFDAATAYDLAQKFEFHFTPKKASWLNVAEIEFSAIARQCLKTRIPTKEELDKQVLTCVKERQDKQIKINWQFDITVARSKMSRHYEAVNTAKRT